MNVLTQDGNGAGGPHRDREPGRAAAFVKGLSVQADQIRYLGVAARGAISAQPLDLFRQTLALGARARALRLQPIDRIAQAGAFLDAFQKRLSNSLDLI